MREAHRDLLSTELSKFRVDGALEIRQSFAAVELQHARGLLERIIDARHAVDSPGDGKRAEHEQHEDRHEDREFDRRSARGRAGEAAEYARRFTGHAPPLPE